LNRYWFATGKSTRLLTGIDNAVAVSPDSKHVAFIRLEKPHECALMIADADGSRERHLASVMAESCRAWFPEAEMAAIEKIGVGLRHQYERQLVVVSTSTGEKKELPVPTTGDEIGLALHCGGIVHPETSTVARVRFDPDLYTLQTAAI
jgi:hypothetical protein